MTAVARAVLAFVLLVVYDVAAARAQATAVDITFAGMDGSLALTGQIRRPDGAGPFPALVLLHGCGGITPTNQLWAETLRRWGYVTLLVDSFGPRGKTNICENGGVDPQYARMPDAYAAPGYLAAQPFVAAGKIGLIGWSHGGMTTLYAVDDVYLTRLGRDRFAAAIAFYPGCLSRLQRLNVPLLILIGEEDDWTTAARCKRMEVEAATSHAVTLTIYPGAYHGFDRPASDSRVYLGHRLERHEEAASDAERRVRQFLTRYLGAS
jgi:dienelactone hydrolase